MVSFIRRSISAYFMCHSKSNTYLEAQKLHQAGMLERALELYDSLDPQNHRNLIYLKACVWLQLEDFQLAARSFEEDLQFRGETPQSLYNLALSLFHLNQIEKAKERALECKKRFPGHTSNLLLLCRIFQDSKNEVEILKLYQEGSLTLNQEGALSYLAQALLKFNELNLLESILNTCEESSNPQEILAWRIRMLLTQNHFHEASKVSQNLVCDCEERANLKAITLIKTKRFDEAQEILEAAIRAFPPHADLYNNLALLFQEKKEFELALDKIEKALELCACGEYKSNFSSILIDMGELERAREYLDENKEELSDLPDYYLNLTYLSHKSGDYEKTRSYLMKALELDPRNQQALYELSLIELLERNYKKGFVLFEARFHCPRLGLPEPSFKEWDGQQKVETLQLVSEQGFGDSLQFIRFLPFLLNQVNHVILSVHPSLKRLFELLPYEIEVCSEVRSDLPGIYLPSLPKLYDFDSNPLPEPIPFLKKKNNTDPKPQIGICLRGNPAHKNDHNRSIPQQFLQNFTNASGADFYSFQYGDKENSQKGSIQPALSNWGDFLDTALRLAEMDLLISVDTSMIHLAGNLGLESFLLIPQVPDWRWGKEELYSSWYPSVRILRQKQAGNWNEVFEMLNALLKERYPDLKPGLESKSNSFQNP